MAIVTKDVIESILKTSTCLSKLSTAYQNDLNTHKNEVLFISGSLGLEQPITATLDVRGMPNKGDSTENIAKQLFELFNNKTYQLFSDKQEIITLDCSITNFAYNGIDDRNRLSMAASITLYNISVKKLK